jgi:hypothetical protein
MLPTLNPYWKITMSEAFSRRQGMIFADGCTEEPVIY